MTVTLDWLLSNYSQPNFVKIDVEGAEFLVLKGAHRLLSDVRPTILCEVSAHCADAVTALFRHHSYNLYDAEKPRRLARSA